MATSMTQAEFNTMLQIAIAQGLPGGVYSSKFGTGEEIDERLSKAGLTPYDYAKEAGFTGTEAKFNEFLASGPNRIPENIKFLSVSKIVNSVGWRRILSAARMTGLILHVSNWFSAGGPTSMLLSATMSEYYPQISILSSIDRSRFDKARITKDAADNYYVDLHHNYTSSNTVVSNMIAMRGSYNTFVAQSFEYDAVGDAPAGETVLLEKALI